MQSEKSLAETEGSTMNRGKWIDRLWRNVLADLFDEAIEFFMPELAKAMDPTQQAVLLNEEQPAIGAEDDKGMRIPDMVVSVPLKGGGEQRIAVVIEQQHWHDPFFALRMFEGFYRVSDSTRKPVTSLAIFTGRIREVDRYEYGCFGTELNFRYNSYAVAGADIEALRNDKRVFALVVLAARMMLEAGTNPQNREKYARELLHLMRERDYNIDKKRNVLKFVGHALRLGDGDISREMKEEWNMIAIPMQEAARRIELSNAYENGMDEGMEKGMRSGLKRGMEKGKVEMAKNLIKSGVSAEIIAKSSGLSLDEVRSLRQN